MRKDEYEEMQRLSNQVHILTARITELEAAAQWHPACEPPSNNRKIEGQTKYGEVWTCIYHADTERYGADCYGLIDLLRWRDLPPMPVKGSGA